MDAISYRTVSLNQETINKEWVIIDAQSQILGRLSSQVAKILRGKTKTGYTPHVDCGDHVIVINAAKVRLTGKKLTDSNRTTFSGYPGGLRIKSPADILAKKPEKLIEICVKGMLPHTKLGRAIYKNLHVYAGGEHPHQAQNPKEIKLNEIK